MEKESPVKVRKAVIAAAGFGTRFLEWTKSMPKEMLPLITKPIIQYVVEELVDAGIEEIYIIGSSNKRAIEDHFDFPSSDLLDNLRAGGAKKLPYIEKVQSIASLADFTYKRQKGPYGNATPITTASGNIGNEPFIYTFADDFFRSDNGKGRTAQMLDIYNKYGGSSVLACKKVVREDEYEKYGIVAGKRVDKETLLVDFIDEKPGNTNAKSDLASVSGYLFEPDMIKYLIKAEKNHDPSKGEFMIQPVMQQMIEDGYKFYAKEIVNATYHDTGDVQEYHKTVFEFSLKDPLIGRGMQEFVIDYINNNQEIGAKIKEAIK